MRQRVGFYLFGVAGVGRGLLKVFILWCHQGVFVPGESPQKKLLLPGSALPSFCSSALTRRNPPPLSLPPPPPYTPASDCSPPDQVVSPQVLHAPGAQLLHPQPGRAPSHVFSRPRARKPSLEGGGKLTPDSVPCKASPRLCCVQVLRPVGERNPSHLCPCLSRGAGVPLMCRKELRM